MMEFRKLGRTGLRVSTIGVGTWQLSGPLTLDGKADGFPDPGPDAVVALIRACGDLGINFIDCAEVYGDGEGERRVGQAIRGNRDSWIVASKFGLRRGPSGERVLNASPQLIQSSLENSLRRLQTDHLDLYLYHSSPEENAIAEGRNVLEGLKRQGKIRYYGISTNDPQVLGRLMQHDAVDVVMYSHSVHTDPREVLSLVGKGNLGGMVRGALEGGRLSGRYFHSAPVLDDQDIRKFAFRHVDTRAYAVYEKALPAGMSMTEVALRYVLDFETSHTLVLGGKSIEHYREASKVVGLPHLDAATREALRRAKTAITGPSVVRRIAHRLTRWVSPAAARP